MSEMVAVAAARAIIFKLPMPAAKVESPSAAYDESALVYVRDKISCFSDMFPIDAGRTLELARKFWMLRYNVTYPSELVFASGDAPSTSFMFGFGDVFADTELTFVKTNMRQLAILTNKFVKVLSDVSCEE